MENNDIQKIALELIEQYGTVTELRKHSATLYQQYGKETYREIFRAYQALRQERIMNESSGVCSHQEGAPVKEKQAILDMKPEIKATLEECQDLIEEAKYTLEMVKDDEEMAYDNLPEGIQMSERGDTMQEGIDALDDAIYSLDDTISYLSDAIDSKARELFVERHPWSNAKVGDTVEHQKFGPGVITIINDRYIFVRFQSKEVQFGFPSAFEKGYLTING